MTIRPSSHIELSRAALARNVRFVKALIGSNVTLSSVVKGNAYGHQIEAYVPLAEACGIRHFSVFSAAEAERVLGCRTADSTILIMGDIHDADLPWAASEGIEVVVFDLDRLDAAIRAARKVGRALGVHLEVETGLHRTGLSPRSLEAAARRLHKHPRDVQAAGVCTHLVGAESSNNFHRIDQQLDRFREATAQLAAMNVAPPRHVACSAATLTMPETTMDMVRVGIALYGYWPSEETRFRYLARGTRRRSPRYSPLTPILTWRSRIMNLKSVRSGQFIGYGSAYQASRTMRVAAVPVGYYHGFGRDLSNRGRVLVRGARCGVVGLVNMSMLMVDVSEIRGVSVGDEVVIIGAQGEHQISVGSFGELTHVLNYEVLVSLPQEIPRVIVD